MHRVHTEVLNKTEKRAIWDEIIQDFLASGKGLKDYSVTHELDYHQLTYYVGSYKTKKRGQEIGFVPVQVPSSLSMAEIKITYRNIIITLLANTPLSYVQQLIQGLA